MTIQGGSMPDDPALWYEEESQIDLGINEADAYAAAAAYKKTKEEA